MEDMIIAIDGFKQDLARLIYNSGLPMSMIHPILSAALSEVAVGAQQEVHIALAKKDEAGSSSEDNKKESNDGDISNS